MSDRHGEEVDQPLPGMRKAVMLILLWTPFWLITVLGRDGFSPDVAIGVSMKVIVGIAAPIAVLLWLSYCWNCFREDRTPVIHHVR